MSAVTTYIFSIFFDKYFKSKKKNFFQHRQFQLMEYKKQFFHDLNIRLNSFVKLLPKIIYIKINLFCPLSFLILISFERVSKKVMFF